MVDITSNRWSRWYRIGMEEKIRQKGTAVQEPIRSRACLKNWVERSRAKGKELGGGERTAGARTLLISE